MQRVVLLCNGKLKEKFYMEAVAEYQKRLSRFCRFEIIELPEERLPENPSPALIEAALAKEAAVMEEKVPSGAYRIAMCIEGKLRSSEELSSLMEQTATNGYSCLCFFIGSSFGLHKSIKDRADFKLSMSPMTFPHHLARVMLLEQIYRGYQITAGSKYHK